MTTYLKLNPFVRSRLVRAHSRKTWRRAMYYKCCVQNCASTKLDAKLYKFPTNENRLNVWLHALNDTKLVKAVKNLFLCELHFEKQYFGPKSRLLSNACPTLFTTDEIASGIPKIRVNVDPQIDHLYSRRRHNDHNYSKNPYNSGSKQQREVNPLQPEESTVDTSTTEPNKKVKEAPFHLQQSTVNRSTISRDQYITDWDDSFSWQQDSDMGFSGVADIKSIHPETLHPEKSDENPLHPQESEEEPLHTAEEVFSWQQHSVVVPFDEEDADVSLWGMPVRSGAVKRSPSPGQVPQAPTYDHSVYRCDECLQDIQGFRYTCVQCVDVDLCGACEARQAHATHYVLRIPGPRPHSEVMSMLQTLRRALSDVIEHADDRQSPKVEIKQEDDQEESIHIDTDDIMDSNNEENDEIENDVLFVENIESSYMENDELEDVIFDESENVVMFVDNLETSDVEDTCSVDIDADIQNIHRDTYTPSTKIKETPILKSPVLDKKIVILQPVSKSSLHPTENVVQIKPIKDIQTITNKENQKELLNNKCDISSYL